MRQRILFKSSVSVAGLSKTVPPSASCDFGASLALSAVPSVACTVFVASAELAGVILSVAVVVLTARGTDSHVLPEFGVLVAGPEADCPTGGRQVFRLRLGWVGTGGP